MMQRAYRMNKVEDVKLQHELFNQNREKVGNTQYISYMIQRAFRMNKVEKARLQHELFNQNREKVGNTQYLLHDAKSLQDEQSGGGKTTAWELQPKQGEGR